MNKKSYTLLAIIILAILLGVIVFYKKPKTEVVIKNFQECADAGYPVMESYPRQCKTPNGLTFAEEITIPVTYVNTSKDYIQVDLPYPGAVTGKEFKVIGRARGFYFEASFPVEVLDKDGKRIFIGPAQAQGEWMVDSLVPFEITVKIPDTYIGPATIVLHKDNPSDMRQYDASASFPITIEY